MPTKAKQARKMKGKPATAWAKEENAQGRKGDEPPIHCSHSAVAPLANLKPNPRNPNKHPEAQIKLLAKVITKSGWRSPIVVSKRSGLIVKGHGRYEVAKLAGLTVAPVDFQDYATASAEMADMIADNRLAELAEMEMPEIKELLKELEGEGFDLDLTGYDADALASLMLSVNPEDAKDSEPQIERAK